MSELTTPLNGVKGKNPAGRPADPHFPFRRPARGPIMAPWTRGGEVRVLRFLFVFSVFHVLRVLRVLYTVESLCRSYQVGLGHWRGLFKVDGIFYEHKNEKERETKKRNPKDMKNC